MGTSETVEPAERKLRISQSTIFLLLAFLIAFIAAWPLISNAGFLNTRGGGDSPFLLQRLHQLEKALSDIYFDYDRFTIREDAASLLKSNAQLLKAEFAEKKIVIEGKRNGQIG